MTSIQVTFTIPAELVEQARVLNIELTPEMVKKAAIEALEKQLARQKAAQRLLKQAKQLQALPEELKPTADEIDSARQAFWDEQVAAAAARLEQAMDILQGHLTLEEIEEELARAKADRIAADEAQTRAMPPTS